MMGFPNRREFLKNAGATAAFTSHRGLRAGAIETHTADEKIRGVMVDAARLPENIAYYRRLIDFCAEWQLNTVQFRLTDDQGSALRFSSVPHLIEHPHAFTPDELSKLAEYGASRGVDLLPEVEAFGHTGYITRSPEYAHLLDRDPQGSTDFTGIIPVHPESPELFNKLFREIASIFPSKYLHGGCDEVNWGGSALSRQALQTRSRADIWAAWLNQLSRILQPLQKTLIVWGDIVLGKEPAVLSKLEKSIVVMDWNYWDTDPVPFADALARVRKNGSRGIGAPGLISYRWGPRPGTSQLGNIDAFANAYLASREQASLGVILTNWVPSRYIQNSLWDGLAYAAIAFNHGTVDARNWAFRRFVEHHWAAHWNDTWRQIFALLYDAAPIYGDTKGTPLRLRLPVPFSTDAELITVLKGPTNPPNPFPRLRELLVAVHPDVTRNRPDFEALLLSVRYLETLFWRQGAIQERTATKRLDREGARSLIQTISKRDRSLLDELSRDWDSGRPHDSPARLMPLYGMAPKDQLLFQWSRATAFSIELSTNPDRFFAALHSAGLLE